MVFFIWVITQAGRYLEVPASSPMKADVLVVLGGGIGDRTIEAARIYSAGFAQHILVTGIEGSPSLARAAYLD